MAPLNVCLIGHRGVGKTAFLARLVNSDPTWRGYDLDAEIERTEGRSVAQIFAADGEPYFRAREAEVLMELLRRPGPKVIAVGAGYAGPRPVGAVMVWLRRSTDRAGRIFGDRPRLNAAISLLDEYLERYPAREERYGAWADLTLMIPEGYDGGLEDLFEASFQIPYDLTVTPRAARDWSNFWARREHWGLRRLEVRDDLVAGELDPAPPRLLRAYRRGPAPARSVDAEDWALELGPPPRGFAVISVHAGDVPLACSALSYFDDSIQKMAVEVNSFAHLIEGHRWWREDPTRRAFLPRSTDGRWRWYRALFGPRMPIHFVREDDGSALDQPPLWQVRLQTPLTESFAAVLGDPVEHSRTPMEQREFFARRGQPVVAIEVLDHEWDQALPILRELGLTHAAVTAPLKKLAFAAATDLTDEARDTAAANTLYFDRDRIFATNTDVIALRTLSRELNVYRSVWIWGGGGVTSSVADAWPNVRRISARAGLPAGESTSPDLLIWAVGRSRALPLPPSQLRPGLVLDLNYADDSPGLEYAVTHGLAYQSGLRMFKLQAEAQREFWTAREGSGARQSIR